jgi:hypothetical protein
MCLIPRSSSALRLCSELCPHLQTWYAIVAVHKMRCTECRAQNVCRASRGFSTTFFIHNMSEAFSGKDQSTRSSFAHIRLLLYSLKLQYSVSCMQPKYLPPMIDRQAATGCDIVTGTRYLQGGGVFGWDLKRKVTSRGANLLAQLLLQPNVSDLTGSMRLYQRDAFEQIIRQVKSKVLFTICPHTGCWMSTGIRRYKIPSSDELSEVGFVSPAIFT